MNKILWSILGVSLTCQVMADPNKDLLPSPFPVYIIKNSGVVNHPYPGATKVLLPTDNSYTESPGCYVVCYSHKKGIYEVGPSISVMGQIRVKGEYTKSVCQPDGYQGKDISTEPMFKLLCAKKIPSCADNGCWVGGATGGWFGIQP